MAPPPDDYGWAYIDPQRATASADGPSGSLQFRWGSENLIPGRFSGSEDLVFYAASDSHKADPNASGSALYLYGDMYVTGAIHAETYTIRQVTATEVDVSGSTTFGDTADDTHQRTGSLEVGGPTHLSGTVYVYGTHPKIWLQPTDAAGDSQILFKSEDGSAMGNIRVDVTNNLLNHISFNANSGEDHLVVDSGGKVGVGVTDPDSHLEVLGTSNQFKLSYNASKYTTFNTDATGFLTITPSDGRTNLVNSSYVNLNTPTVHIGENDTSDVQLNFRGSTNDLPIDYDESAKKLAFDTSDLVIDAANASVGIGTATPNSQPDEKNDLVIGDLTGNRGMTIASAGTGMGTIRFARSANANDGEGWIDYSGNTKKMRIGTDGLNTRLLVSDTGIEVTGSAWVSSDAIINNNILVASDIRHLGDEDTKISFADDGIDIRVGNARMINMTEDGSQDFVKINSANADIDFIVDGDTNEKIFHVQAAAEASGPAEMVHISGTLGPVSGSGEIHAAGFTGNDASLSASLTIGTANAVGSQVPLTINRSGSTQAVVIAGGMTASHNVHVEHLYTNDLYVSGTAYGITVDRANYASASDTGTTRTYSPSGFDTSGYLHVSGSTILGSSASCNVMVTGSFEASGPANFTSVVTAENDLTVGALFKMTDNTSAKILVADGTSYQEVAIQGDVTISSAGAVTIASNAVESGMLNDNIISGQTELAHADIADADELMISDAGALKRVGVDSLRDHYFGVVSGDATVADGGALTIAANAVEGSMLNTDAISAQTEMTGDVADTDEVLISDAGTLKRADFSVLRDAVFNDVSGDATVAAGGALTIANDAVEQAMIADDAVGADQLAASAVVNASIVDGTIKADKLDIDGSTDIGGALTGTDLIIVDDGAGGTNRKAALSRVATYTKTDVGAVGAVEGNKAIIVDGNANINSGLASVTGSKDLYFKDVKATSNLISDGGLLVSGSAVLSAGLTSSMGLAIPDNEHLRFGAANDLKVFHNGSNTLFVNQTGHLRFDNQATGKHIQMDLGADDATTQFQVRKNNGNDLLVVDGVGMQVTGTLEVSSTANLQAANLYGAASGSSTLAIQGSASFGAPVDISGDLVFHAAATAGRIDIKVNDGNGADTAIQIGKNGIVTKIGDDTPGDGQYLSWDNTAGKVAWADGLTTWGMSGSDAHYSSTELRTSGDLKVSGSVTFAGVQTGGYSVDGAQIKFGADEEVKLVHSPDDGLIIKRTATGDNNPTTLTLQTGETALVATDTIGALQFQAPDETQGGDAALVCAAIVATATDTFDATSNSTSLDFKTATDGAAVTHIKLLGSGKLQGYGNNSTTWDITADGTGSFQQLAVADKLVHVGDADTGIFLETNSVKIHAATNSQPQITVNNTEVVINESSNALDFRVESNSQDKMFFVDGGNNKIQIGNGFGDSGIDIHQTGSIQMDGHIQARGGFITEGDIEVSGDLTITGDLIASSATPEFSTVTVASDIVHTGDANTKIAFDTDQMTLWAGGRNMLQFIEDDTQDTARFNTGNNDIDFVVSTSVSSGSFKIDGDTGDVHIGGSQVVYDHSDCAIRVYPNDTATQAKILLHSRDTHSADEAQLQFLRYTDGSLGAGDNLGIIQFKGAETVDGTYYTGAAIVGEVDEAAWTDGSSAAGRLLFYTTPDGSTTGAERLRIDSDGLATFAGNVYVDGEFTKDITIHTSAAAQLALVSDGGQSSVDFYGRGNSMSTGDNIGALRFYGTEADDAANNAITAMLFVETAESGWAYNSSLATKMRFQVGRDGQTGLEDALCIDGSVANVSYPFVGVGTTSPDAKFHIVDPIARGEGSLRVSNTDTSLSDYDTIVNLRTADSTFGSTNYWIKFYDSTSGATVGSINSEVAYTTFTGQHPTPLPSGSALQEGALLASTGQLAYDGGMSNAWVSTRVTTAAKDKAVVGVYRGLHVGAEESYMGEDQHVYNAIGEGKVLVTDQNGNIETGDYICSSDRAGHGMLQDDDLLHNYTVAKATVSVDFSTIAVDSELGFKSVLIACTYHAG